MLNTVIIIAGGESSRLKPLTDDKPKTMVEILNKPILYWIIKWLKGYKINHLVIGVGYKKEKIYEFMEGNRNFGLDVDFVEDRIKGGGTAHAFKNAIEYVHDKNFIGMNSDELTDMNLSRLMKKHEKYKPLVTMALSPFYCRFSVVKVGNDSNITDFEYGKKLSTVPVSMGVYAFKKEVAELIPERGSIEDSLFTNLAKQGRGEIIGDLLAEDETWVSVNTHKDIKEAEALLRTWNREQGSSTL